MPGSASRSICCWVKLTGALPLDIRGTVVSLHPDDPIGGIIAVVRAGGVNVIITSRRKPYHYLKDFTDLGLDPTAHKLLVVKIGYLVPELRQIAQYALLALTPGAVNQDIPALSYRRVVRPIFPLDPEFTTPDLQAQLFGGPHADPEVASSQE